MSTKQNDRLIAEVLGDEVALSPSDLVSRAIKKQAVGGYDTNEVDDLLEQTAEVLEKLLARVRELKATNETLQSRVEEYREVETSLRNALVTSQKFADDIVENAKREAGVILGEARLHQKQAEADAARLPETITREIRLLMEERDRIRDDVLAVLDAHRRWVEERVPERDSALSERLLAFVNSRQGISAEEVRSVVTGVSQAAEPVAERTGNSAESEPEAEDDALPDMVLEMEPAVDDADSGAVLEAVAEEDPVERGPAG